MLRRIFVAWLVALIAIGFVCLSNIPWVLASNIVNTLPVISRTSTNNNTEYANWTGSLTPGDCVKIDANHNLVDQGTTCGAAGPGGTVTMVSFTGGLISVANPSTTPALTVAGTSGGLPYFASASTWASSAAGTIGHLVLWGGAGNPPTDGGLPGAAQLHSISFVIDGGGSVIALGDAKVYPTAAFACTINRWDISADQSGSVTVDVWKAAGAIPTSGNKISASAPLTLSTAQLAQNGSLSGWGLGVSSGDVFGFSVATATTITRITGQIWCQ